MTSRWPSWWTSTYAVRRSGRSSTTSSPGSRTALYGACATASERAPFAPLVDASPWRRAESVPANLLAWVQATRTAPSPRAVGIANAGRLAEPRTIDERGARMGRQANGPSFAAYDPQRSRVAGGAGGSTARERERDESEYRDMEKHRAKRAGAGTPSTRLRHGRATCKPTGESRT